MAGLEKAKKQRSTAKKGVTQTAGKLVNAVELGQADKVLVPLVQNLDSVFELFNDAHVEYEELSPDKDTQGYYSAVCSTYMSAKKTHLDLINLHIANPSKILLANNMDRASKLLSILDSMLDSDDCKIDLITGVTYKVDMLLVDILKDKAILDALGTGEDEGTRAHEMVVRFDYVKLEVQSQVRQHIANCLAASAPC